MKINVSDQYIINSLSDMDKISLETNAVENIGTINYDYVEINNKKLIFYTEKENGGAIITLELEVDKIDFIDFDAEVIVLV